MSANNGGPAFPALTDFGPDHDGMTLRDYFAAKDMHGIIANPDTFCPDDEEYKSIAECAYAQADAMLKEREK